MKWSHWSKEVSVLHIVDGKYKSSHNDCLWNHLGNNFMLSIQLTCGMQNKITSNKTRVSNLTDLTCKWCISQILISVGSKYICLLLKVTQSVKLLTHRTFTTFRKENKHLMCKLNKLQQEKVMFQLVYNKVTMKRQNKASLHNKIQTCIY